MDMLKDMNRALDYIEAHLDREIDFNRVAQTAGVSEYHFRKMFSYLSGMSLSSYIRLRKLSEAGRELQKGDLKVLDAAVKYGYDSADGFSRAFREWSGMNPSEVSTSSSMKVFPRMTFQLTIRGGINMDVRIEQKDAFRLVGIKKRVPIQFEGQNPEIMKMVQEMTPEQREQLQRFRNTDVKTVVNASYNFDEGRNEEIGELDHMIGSITTLDENFNGFDVVDVPALTWAIFRSTGPFPQTMQDTWAKIASEWLPASEYELVDAPEISFTEDMSDLENVTSEIWMAVQKR